MIVLSTIKELESLSKLKSHLQCHEHKNHLRLDKKKEEKP